MFKKFLPLILLALSISAIHAQTVAYVANADSNTVSVIDTATNTVTATIPVGTRPQGVVFSPDSARVYVTQEFGTVSVIDTGSKTVTATITVESANNANLFSLAITPDGKSLYVSDLDNGLFVVSTATNSVVATLPGPASAVAISPDGTRAYVQSGFGSSTGVRVIDTATNAVIATIPQVNGAGSTGIAVTPDGLTVYAVGNFGRNVSAIATGNNAVTATIPFTNSPQGIAITPDGSRAYVASFSTFSGIVNIIDTATNTLEPISIATGGVDPPEPPSLAITPDGAFVYAPNAGDGTVSVIDTSTNSVVHTLTVGDSPFGIAIANLSSPFAAFTIDNLVINNNLHEQGDFTLGANTGGIDLAHQPLTLTVNGFSLTIPAGSFRQVGGNMHFVFNGTVNGLSVNFNLQAVNGSSTQFTYVVDVHGVSITGPNPATVGLKIGHNTGSTTAPF